MKLSFDDRIPQAKKEYSKNMEKRHVGRLYAILNKIKEHGFKSISPEHARHLWDDVYEIKPDNRRVIYVKVEKDEGIIVKVYIKKSNKMPTNVKKSIEYRVKSLL